MAKYEPNESSTDTLYLIFYSLLLLGVTMHARCQKWWLVPSHYCLVKQSKQQNKNL